MRHRTQQGFTIVELVIVIVVIAILASISIVAYTGIQSRAHDTKMLATSQQIERKMQEYTILAGRINIDPSILGDKESVLSELELSPLENTVDYYTSEVPANQYDRKKVFMRAYASELNWSYWDNEKNSWTVNRMDGSGIINTWQQQHPDPWAGM